MYSSYILRRPHNIAKSSPYFCPIYCQSKEVRYRFLRILWPSQNICKNFIWKVENSFRIFSNHCEVKEEGLRSLFIHVLIRHAKGAFLPRLRDNTCKDALIIIVVSTYNVFQMFSLPRLCLWGKMSIFVKVKHFIL